MIYAYFYQIEYSEKCSFYKRNFLNQLINLVDISEKLERCNEIEKADIIFTIADFVNDVELIDKKLVVYSLQDNSFTNQEIIVNKNVLFIADHCKFCNGANEEYNKKVFFNRSFCCFAAQDNPPISPPLITAAAVESLHAAPVAPLCDASAPQRQQCAQAPRC